MNDRIGPTICQSESAVVQPLASSACCCISCRDLRLMVTKMVSSPHSSFYVCSFQCDLKIFPIRSFNVSFVAFRLLIACSAKEQSEPALSLHFKKPQCGYWRDGSEVKIVYCPTVLIEDLRSIPHTHLGMLTTAFLLLGSSLKPSDHHVNKPRLA